MKPEKEQIDGSALRLVFTKVFRKRFFLRFHMFLILTATILSGVLASRVLLFFSMNNMVIRYPLAVACSYLVFFLLIKIWLWYISIAKPFESSDSLGNLFTTAPDPPVSGTSIGEVSHFGGGLGGRSGGGGASGAFGDQMPNVQESLVRSSGAADHSGNITDGVGSVVSGFDDDSFILVVLGVLLAVIFGASLYMIIDAPHILSDAAFNFLLASSLMRSYRTINKPEWFGSVFRETCIPFLIVLLISTGVAWLIHSRFPHVVKISELVSMLFK